MKIKTQDLTGPALDWAVAKAMDLQGKPLDWVPLPYSTSWQEGGPIIEREGISLSQIKGHPCRAYIGTPAQHDFAEFAPEGQPLSAAMRCFVASRLGDEVDIPEELL